MMEGKTAIHWTRLSCYRLPANEARLLLGVIGAPVVAADTRARTECRESDRTSVRLDSDLSDDTR